MNYLLPIFLRGIILMDLVENKTCTTNEKTSETSNVVVPIANARFDDAHPRMFVDQKGELYEQSVWYMDTDLHSKITQPLCFCVTLRPDGLGLSAQPDETSWELMKHRGGKRLIEIAAKNATQSMMFNITKDLASDLITMQPVPKGYRRNVNALNTIINSDDDSEDSCGFDIDNYDPSCASTASPMIQMAMTLTNGPVWLPPAPTARIRGWATQERSKDED